MKKNRTMSIRKKMLPLGLLCAVCLFGNSTLKAQGQVYDNFEGTRVLKYGERFGVLDSAVKNPAPNNVNNSPACALYVRSAAKKFANIKMTLERRLTGVEKYATYEGTPPRIKMKVYTTAPAGTLVEILLGSKRGNNDYPAGTHSQYQAYTSTSNEWEELEFKFAQIPQGSETSADQIDQIVLLFNPNSSTSDTYYFDDISGPSLGNVPVEDYNVASQEQKEDAAETDQKQQSAEKVNSKKSEKKSKKKN